MAAEAPWSSTRIDSLERVDPQAWDRLARDATVYQSHAWLRLIERGGRGTAAYVVVQAEGRLIGAMPVYDRAPGSSATYDPRAVGGFAARGWVLCGARAGYANDALVDSELGAVQQTAVLGAMVREVREHWGEQGLAALYARRPLVERLRDAAAVAELTRAAAAARVAVVASSWDEHLASVHAHRRKRYRKETSAFRETYGAAEIVALRDVAEEAAPLLAELERRHGDVAAAHHAQRYLGDIAECFGTEAVAFCVRRAGRLVGFSLFLAWGDTLYGRVCGFDYSRLADAYEYFNLVMYEPVRHAIACGVRAVELGPSGLQAKALRGAVEDARWHCRLEVDAPDS